MKKLILLAMAIALPLSAGATDLKTISREWGKKVDGMKPVYAKTEPLQYDGGFADINVKFNGRNPNIKDFFSARLFDNGGADDDEEEGEGRECLGDIAAAWTLYLQGQPLDEGCTFTVDTANGYMRYDAQYSDKSTKQMEMCYWNCSDGKHKLVAENIECYDEYGKQIQTECTGWTLFVYDNYFHRMCPVGSDEWGFDYDGLFYSEPGASLSIALPRQGKTVVITCQTPSGKQTMRLTWNGSKFIKE